MSEGAQRTSVPRLARRDACRPQVRRPRPQEGGHTHVHSQQPYDLSGGERQQIPRRRCAVISSPRCSSPTRKWSTLKWAARTLTRNRMSSIFSGQFLGVSNVKLTSEAPGSAPPSIKAATLAQARATPVAMTIAGAAAAAAAADATDTVRRMCVVSQAIACLKGLPEQRVVA